MKTERWIYRDNFYEVCRLFNQLTPEQQDSPDGRRLQLLGLLYSPFQYIRAFARVSPEIRVIATMIDYGFVMPKSNTPLDVLRIQKEKEIRP